MQVRERDEIFRSNSWPILSNAMGKLSKIKAEKLSLNLSLKGH
jgi:hypothetical protein